jgi:hypothetical protein
LASAHHIAVAPRRPGSVVGWLSRHVALATALAVFGLAVPALALVHSHSATGDRLPAAAAERAARTSAVVRDYLTKHPATSARVGRLDADHQRVTFFAGGRLVMDVEVDPRGEVTRHVGYATGSDVAGSPTARAWWVLLLLSALFAGLTLRPPWRLARIADVGSMLALTGGVALLDARYLELSLLVSYPALVWLAWRCLTVGWRGVRAERPSAPRATRPAADTRRLLRLVLGALGVLTVGVTVLAPSASDVGFACMRGATLLVHGGLPYGHFSAADIVHGDTYPLLTYLAYVPAALLWPVRDGFDDPIGALVVSAIGAIGVAWGLARVAAAMARRDGDGAADVGLVQAAAWLACPVALVTISAGTSDVLVAASVTAALGLLLRPSLASTALSAGGWLKVVPFGALPMLLVPGRGERSWRRLAGAVIPGVAIAAVLVAMGGAGAVGDMIDAMRYQLQRGSLHSLWGFYGVETPQLLAQAAVLAVIAASFVHVLRRRETVLDVRRMAGLAGAALLGLQLVANYWSFTYVVWAYPCIALALLAPAPRRGPRA